MAEDEIERRTCIRFKIPGATVNYQRKSLLPKPGFMEEFCPVLDISRGGIRFLTQKMIKPDSEVTLRISVPGERIPFSMKGVVKWSSPSEGKSYQFQVGVQFNAYGMDKDQNLPQTMVKIMALEQKFADKAKPGEEPSGPDKDEFQI
jgi:Tfp pilus assembly protein PilZ